MMKCPTNDVTITFAHVFREHLSFVTTYQTPVTRYISSMFTRHGCLTSRLFAFNARLYDIIGHVPICCKKKDDLFLLHNDETSCYRISPKRIYINTYCITNTHAFIYWYCGINIYFDVLLRDPRQCYLQVISSEVWDGKIVYISTVENSYIIQLNIFTWLKNILA